MKHLGDITKLSGYVVPAVDVVIGGSPCQGLSVAGKQAGLKDERSGLFIEQIRLVKEMRKADAARGKTNDAIRPRYMVWENVPGAFSSNQGRDFEAVLEETVRVAEPKAPPVPVPAKGWSTSGCLVGDGWSVAWRVLDAQFWGTPDKPLPQRRRRISLVADFGGRTAPEILFERESVSWNPDESRATAERNPCSPKSGFGNAGRAGMERARRNGEPEPQVIASGVDCRSYNVSEGVSGTILAKRISSHFALEYCETMTDTMYALTNPGDGGRTNSRQVCYAGIVRRLTPLECERLQGYPDGWTDIGSWVDSKGKKHPESSDAARYKALGNSIAIPPWKWVLKRLCAIYERDATMASLFDGIGGFPYIWEQLNGKGSCLWASEIEPFPIAVTKYHFGEE